ncbi:MAG: polysaccharide pyruvyl transferase family protein [Lachnospiraceae bacterium]|nr:polysaccharide pyruvyl transferase family protein [Lachnospiraceae bacterium]
MNYLLLSTYPYSGSLNSGDDLLEKSLIQLIKNKDAHARFIIKNLTDASVTLPDLSDIDAIVGTVVIAPYWSTQKENLILILETALQMNIPIHLILASCFKPITVSAMHKVSLDRKLKNLLCAISRTNVLVTRDLFTLKLAQKNGIRCKSCIGDIALYDIDYIGKPMQTPKSIKTVALSMPHNPLWNPAVIKLAKRIKQKYGCQCVLTLHGITDLNNIASDIKKLHLPVIDLSGSAAKLDYYQNVDMHIGFRLHAHIYCLRIRKPSVLSAEDSRAGGHLYTFNGAGYDATPKIINLLHGTKFCLPLQKYYNFEMRHIWHIIKKEIISDFNITRKNLQLIDLYYQKKTKPFIDNIGC